jgi:hypothetical protein
MEALLLIGVLLCKFHSSRIGGLHPIANADIRRNLGNFCAIPVYARTTSMPGSRHNERIFFWTPSRAALEAKIATFTGSFGFTRGHMNHGGGAFYEQRMLGSDNFDLAVGDKAGKRKIVDLAALHAAHGQVDRIHQVTG